MGIKCTGVSRRSFKPNLQRIHIWLPNGKTTHITVATSVIRTGKITYMVDGKMQTFPLIKASRGQRQGPGRIEEPLPDLTSISWKRNEANKDERHAEAAGGSSVSVSKTSVRGI